MIVLQRREKAGVEYSSVSASFDAGWHVHAAVVMMGWGMVGVRTVLGVAFTIVEMLHAVRGDVIADMRHSRSITGVGVRR